MKKIFFNLMLLCSAFAAQAADVFTEDFENGLPTSAPTSETKVTLASGEWTIKGIAANKNNGSTRAMFSNSSAYIITPALNQPGKVSFLHRSGGNGKIITVEKSTDGGKTWTQLGQVTTSSASNYGSGSFKVNSEEADTEVLIRFTTNSGSTFIDDVKVTLNTGTEVVPTDPDDPTYVVEGIWKPTKRIPEAKNTYYISPSGNDETGDGSLEKPWYNIAVAYAAAQAGDHIICRGGTYKISKYGTDGKLTVRMTKNGTADAPIVIRCADGEKPVFDFEQQLLDCNKQTSKVGDRGILLTGNYHIIYGIHITHAADNGIKLEGSYNRIERCEFSYNLDTGLQLGFGHNFSDSHPGVSKNDGTYCAYNDIVDCDSHHNCDCDANYGSDADGFACKMHNGKGNRFIRCRAWRNSDDAWDLYETDYDVILAECWAWESGNAEDHTWVKEYLTTSASFSGNGNGIKLGGNGSGGSSQGIHYAYNCIAFGCDKSGSVKGFDCNSHKGGHVLVGCLGFDNGYDFMFESGGSDANTKYYNNICLGRQEICVGSDDYNAIASAMSKNGWTNHLVTGIGKDDFVSLDEEDALMPRSLDGSLPRRFGRLAPDSKMIDMGSVSYDIPESLLQDFPFLRRTYTGKQRDLGPYERPGEVYNGISTAKVTLTKAKYLQKGRMVIEKDGQQYSPTGQKMKF